MNQLGSIISSARKAKGFSQEKLAEESKVNLRTIQRIEKGDSIPHGDTLQRIAKALQLPLEELLESGPEINTAYIKLMHFSALIFFFIPLGNIFLPLILWMVKKNTVRNIDFFAKNLLNFQITWTIIFSLPIVLIFVSRVFNINIETGEAYLSPWATLSTFYIFLYTLNLVYSLIVGVLVKEKAKNYFPVSIRFIK
jgi:uncharacterized Tic20 family protein